jgi:hypothetical protein
VLTPFGFFKGICLSQPTHLFYFRRACGTLCDNDSATCWNYPEFHHNLTFFLLHSWNGIDPSQRHHLISLLWIFLRVLHRGFHTKTILLKKATIGTPVVMEGLAATYGVPVPSHIGAPMQVREDGRRSTLSVPRRVNCRFQSVWLIIQAPY